MTLSETKFIITPARMSHAIKARIPTRKAVAEAKAANLEVSPSAIIPMVEPMSSEIAEVTVITVWVELEKSQKTNPANKHA